jgi:hypothetical protein
MQETQSSGLNGSAKVKRGFFQGHRQVGHNHLAHGFAQRTIQDQAEGTFRIMLANQHHGALKKRPTELPAVEQQLALKIFWLGSHQRFNVPHNWLAGKSCLPRCLAAPAERKKGVDANSASTPAIP